MNQNVELFELAARAKFVDPSTQLPPFNEKSLSVLMCIYHKWHRIAWNKVGLFDLERNSCGNADMVLGEQGIICSEYPLFYDLESPGTCDHFGSMQPDLIYFSDDGQSIAIIENKIGAGCTHSADQYGGQFGRYILYLKMSAICNKYLILLTSRKFIMKDHPWYINELTTAMKIQNSAAIVVTRIIFWEDILNAFV